MATEQLASDVLIAQLREELEKRAFHPGESFGLDHIQYCDFCSYSREYIDKHGHGDDCLLRKQP